MRTISAGYFMSLDGVVDAPQEWHFPYATPDLMNIVDAATVGVDALLLGRRTYQEWASFWLQQAGFPMADFINDTHKYVATSTLRDLTWGPVTVLSGDVVAAVTDLKSRPGGKIAINGSHPGRSGAHRAADVRQRRDLSGLPARRLRRGSSLKGRPGVAATPPNRVATVVSRSCRATTPGFRLPFLPTERESSAATACTST